MANGNEPEIDSAIAEQDAINRMRWQAVLALLPSAAEHSVKPSLLLDNVEHILCKFIERHGVVK